MAKNKKLEIKRWIPYDLASVIARRAGVKSRREYIKWWDEVKPVGLPRFPYRVYPEWTTWGNFIGVDNAFYGNEKKVYRQYWEAVRWVQKQGWSSQREYRQMFDEGNVPSDIPKYPESHYSEWPGNGWRVWLGLNIEGRLKSERSNIGIFVLAYSVDQPPNLVESILVRDGELQLRELLSQRVKLRVIKAYNWIEEQRVVVRSILETYASEQEKNIWLVPNIHQLTFELDQVLDWWRPAQ